ncbi:co-chaperone GroES [Kitasatospora sp. NPDC049258]|uniref:co-chaperone GroES n=1 Tax=Kitasatospora sp. NPDC049258 TaxID=3155394 RepID=UPI003441C6A6
MPDFQPKQDRLIVKPIGGAGQGDADTRRGEVMAVGPGRVLESGKLHPLDVKVGQVILFTAFAGSEVEVGGETYVEIPEDEILALSAED